MPRRNITLPANASVATSGKYLASTAAAISEEHLCATHPKTAFANLADAARTLQNHGDNLVEAAIQHVANARADVAVGLVEKLSTDNPKLFVAAVDAFSHPFKPGVQKSASWVFYNLAKFMVDEDVFSRDFAGRRIDLPHGYGLNHGRFTASGAQAVQNGHHHLFKAILPEATRHANTAHIHGNMDDEISPEGRKRKALREATNARSAVWQNRAEGYKLTAA